MRMLIAPLVLFCALALAETPENSVRHAISGDAAVSVSGAVLEDGRLLAVWTTGDANTPQTQVMGAYFSQEYGHWFGPRPMVRGAEVVSGLALAGDAESGELWLFTTERTPSGLAVLVRMSDSSGSQWSEPHRVFTARGAITLGTAVATEDGVAVGFTTGNTAHVAHSADGTEWTMHAMELSGSVSAPAVSAAPGGGFFAYATRDGLAHRHVRAHSADWTSWETVNLPSASEEPARTASILKLDDDRIVSAALADVTRPDVLQIAISHDGGRVWPVRRSVTAVDAAIAPTLLRDDAGVLHILFAGAEGGIAHHAVADSWPNEPMTLRNEPILATTVPPLWYPSHRSTPEDEVVPLPIADTEYFEHMRRDAAESDWPESGSPTIPQELPGVDRTITTPVVQQGGIAWVGTLDGLFRREGEGEGEGEYIRHANYGFDGPLANRIASIAVDANDTLWVATPGGLSTRNADGDWRTIRGREGLPWKELTSIAIDRFDRIWLGSTRGVMLHDPKSEERPWYYRAGKRYLPDDSVESIAVSEDGRSLFVRSAAGYSRIDEVPATLHDKAEYIEERYNERHRRLGLASLAQYPSWNETDTWVHGPQPSDGLWTSYHVTAAGIAYSLTLEERYRESAAESMEAMYLLQNVTGVEGLVARTLVAVDEPAADNFRDATNYHLTADGKYLWRDDVSSDQLDGHFLAFYAYFEHIAQFDPKERARIDAQIRQVLDYILEHNYSIPDWSGERTMWGWWTPEILNEKPIHWQETGIYALMMLSFLKTAYYITEDETYAAHYRELIEKHDFLSLTLLEKKLFPDELNHSDDQLSAVAYYPILQLEYDPFIREALHRACRRHAKVEKPERNSLFAFVYATVDREDADVTGGVRTLREFTRDRRNFLMENSHRRDVSFQPRESRGGDILLVEVLPYDEHEFERWNQDPYRADFGGNGSLEGSGESYLLPYWIGRYHDLITEPR